MKKLNLTSGEKFIASSKVQHGHRKPKPYEEGFIREDLPEGSARRKKTELPYKLLKAGMVEIFNRSDAPALLEAFLNMKLPEVLLPPKKELLTVKEDLQYRKLILNNFKWAVEQVFKIVPRELSVSGNINMEHSLTGLTKRATEEHKSGEVIDMINKRRESELIEYKARDVVEK
jgi:hypothetical protein